MRTVTCIVKRPDLRAWLLAVVVFLTLNSLTGLAAQPPALPAQQDEFVPIDRLPSQEELPATPLVMIAYATAWLAILVYLWSIWHRLARVEREIGDLTRRVQQGGFATRPSRDQDDTGRAQGALAAPAPPGAER